MQTTNSSGEVWIRHNRCFLLLPLENSSWIGTANYKNTIMFFLHLVYGKKGLIFLELTTNPRRKIISGWHNHIWHWLYLVEYVWIIWSIIPHKSASLFCFFRYWSHVVQCTSCSRALKALKAIEVTLQVISVAIVGFFAVAKQGLASNIAKTAVISVAVLCFAASRWLSHFIHKSFYFHDYNHAFK